nr:putative neuroblastoma breakpoint family member 5 isoform X2 [Equus caballus]XP_023496634.1 putative neuroblastoma breakpoint family member 5 isoform X2 [Equus caballus]XP_023496635.1 putative neuroblastoma breakpoint family member 5 isoform X2 [Equus caballus]XP_023496636.1 putative neuroblastoma breakpoint family member 5 isoform X2 [Equus caballus]XP_023496637.1 putative neuroblastoma breakpoint family member 5 isoform X2 [Equus caballus]
MAVCPHALSDPRAEVTLQESNQELRSQLAQSKQDFQALMEEFLVSEAAAYSLATELQKHKCGECKDIIESVLGDKLPFEEGKLAEKSTLAKKLRESSLLIQEQEQQLAYLRHKLQEGREVWALLSQHLNDLLTHNGSDDHQGQAFRQQLAEGYRLAKHLAHILGPGNNEDKEDEKTQGTLTHRLGRDVPPTVEPPLPRACLEEYSWTCATDIGQSESCWTQSSSAVFCFQGLAVSSLADTPSQHTDLEDDGGIQDGLCCSLSSNLLYMKDNGFPKDAVNKYFVFCSIEHDLSSSYRPYSDSSLLFDRHEIFQTLDAEAPTLEAGHRGPLRTNWSFQRPELQASQTQLQPGTQVTSYLLLQLDQLDCGDGKARLGLCSTTWSFRAHGPFRNQWPLFQGLGFDASLRGKKPPKLEGDALEGSAALSAQKQKIIKRKLLFNKWRITCNFPSLQLRVLRYQDLWN